MSLVMILPFTTNHTIECPARKIGTSGYFATIRSMCFRISSTYAL